MDALHFSIIIAVVAATCAFGVAAYSLTLGLFALRAKRRLRLLLGEARDEELRGLINSISEREFAGDELEAATQKIAVTARRLSLEDQRYVHAGLRQTNAVGARRFIRQMLTKLPAQTVSNPSGTHIRYPDAVH